MKQYKFDFDDILFMPAVISNIISRQEINIYDENGFLPIFTAPMDTVISDINKQYFIDNKIYTMSNRTENKIYSTNKFNWVAIGLKEYEKYYIENDIREVSNSDKEFFVLIDIANGHLQKLCDIVKLTKEKYGDIVKLMVGNVANPETYKLLSDAGSWGVRLGIGGGSGCLTSVQVGIGFPMASLIKETYEISCTLDNPAKIVADGGIKSYSDIIKAIGLGSDFCMIGGIFNRSLESCAETYTQNVKHEWGTEPGEIVDQYSETTKLMFQHGQKYFKKFRGMSTKDVQKSLGNTVLKTSEGITRMNPVEYTLEGWIDNFKHYLGSAMSYCSCASLDEFIGKVEYNMITQNAFKRFNK